MTLRKQTTVEKIRDLKNEIDTMEKFLAPKLKEVMELEAISKIRLLTKEERERRNKLIEDIHEKNCEIAKNKNTINKFYSFSAA